MFRIVLPVALAFLSATVAYGESPRYCRHSFAPGERVETRFMGLGYALEMYALAEKYCGAKSSSMETKFLDFLKKQGCDAETEVYRNTQALIAELEPASLLQMAQDGNASLSLSDQQVTDWAKNASSELGGCDRLIKFHDADPETWQ